ncbi:uncharacterized protein LOC124344087 [Daphnia pulicaria]|uniref:uncharacterized protein LOC124344087 n=1 Tax=Daphnia pulicaria TaxID=35523 RepID=UPI001EEB1D50|nr:uncharacterized protein LOC124344087 [Daphnia pulicaria]XP_046653474.1 uncharacterized protein LOC124344087 [Daphnia pulicaria]XP_046653475.1 uncharacterized protein LOC124344087 [Daphnia pulicaria]XP_046653476.1 uncharacterized protein LOC124344087 [Daphnia pulicaria]XP_046653477.1 uncharacterized protein LOC124344087 [Daphnia pulicaria]XP_046653478.1 uncharacterized protein LOC124344087 [Daphnia pulicaria]
MSRRTQRAPIRIVDGSNGEWDEFDPRLNDYTVDNFYTSGPRLHLPPNMPYAMRKTAVSYKLFVSGIHPHTTEEIIRHTFSNYGQPLSVFRTRNKCQQPIALVEFETQCEADYAIVELDGKPPLNWEVAYAMSRKSEEMPYQQFASLMLDSDFERQTPMFQTSGVGIQTFHSKQSPVHRNTESSMELVRMTNNSTTIPTEEFLPCFVCGTEAPLVCTICKTRYCSRACQGSDWPTHQSICRPPPALEPANLNSDKGNRATQLHPSSGNRVVASAREYPNNSFPRVSAGASAVIQQDRSVPLEGNRRQQHTVASELTRPQSCTVKGIHPIDPSGASSGVSIHRPVDLSVTIHRNINVGSKTISPDMRIVQGISDVPVHSERSPHAIPHTTPEAQPSKGCLNNPSRNSRLAHPHSNMRSGASSVGSEPVSRERQYDNSLLGAIPKHRNIPMATNIPRTPNESPPHRASQPQTSRTAKIYAAEFSSRKLTLPSDKPQQVSVCFVKSPSEFFIQYDAFREILTKLMESINKSAAISNPLINPVEGMPCVALYPDDGSWNRAQILKVLSDGIGIRYVDFGNTVQMPNSSELCRMMEHSLSEYPFYAIKVKLADVVPVNGSSWDTDTNRKFKDIVLNQAFLMECVQLDADAMSVRLKNPDGVDLVSHLLHENLVKRAILKASDELDRIPSADGIPSLPHLQQLVQKPQILHSQFRGTSTTTSSLVRSPQASVQAAAPKELASTTLTVPSQTSFPGHSPTRAALRHDACVIQPRAPTIPSVPVRPNSLPIHQTVPSVSSTPLTPKAHSVIEVIEAGSKVMFQVTKPQNGGDHFSGMLVRGEEDLPIFDFSSFADTIETIPDFRPTVGSFVAAVYSADSQWYRGCVTKVLKSSYNVLFVDFGNEDENVVSVKPIPASFQHEMLAIRLSLVGNLASPTKQYAEESMFPDSSHSLEITSKMADGSALAKFDGENVPTCIVKIEPWTSLLAEPEVEVSPAPEASPAPKVSLAPKLSLVPIPYISSPNWEVGFSCNVIPLAAEDLDCIYVRADTEETKALTTKIQKELKGYFPYSVKLPTVPAIGSCVAAIFSDDGDLYRARITDINGEAISIIFVDVGKSSTVSLSGIRVLPDCFYDYPSCSERVSLARVERPAGSLPTTVQELLTNCINKLYKMFVMPSTSEWTECTLMQDGEVLNEQIIDCLEQLTNTTSHPSNQMPELEIASPGDVYIPGEVAPVDNTLSDLSYDDGIFMDLPEEGSFEAIVTCVDGPQLIMMHAADEQISKKLAKLEEEMEDYAKAIARGHGPKLNEICLALYPDGKWYRSVCLDVIADPAGSRYMCLQVDYGETHIIDIDDIRRIPRRFIDFLPYLAQHAILEGTDAMEEVKQDLVTRFSDILPKNSKVTVSVVSRVEITYIVRIPEVAEILASEGLSFK